MWQLQKAKNKFSWVVTKAMDDGPQIITRHGVEVAILLSYQEYKKRIGSSHQAQTTIGEIKKGIERLP